MIRFGIIMVLLMSGFTLTGQKVTISREVRMLALGDSYTIGQSVSEDERWPHQFIDELRAMGVVAGYPDYIATTGWTTRSLINGINSMLNEEKDYNLVSILIGVNNQYQGIPISTYEPDLRKIIDTALYVVEQDTSRIMILSIPDYAYTPFGGGDLNISMKIDDYNEIKKMVAEEYGIAFINITPISRNGLANPALVASDGLHPSGTQYGLWVKEILPLTSLDFSTSTTRNVDPTEDLIFSIYPNPATHRVIIQINNKYGFTGGTMEIIRVDGVVADKLEIQSFTTIINLNEYEPGVYYLRYSQENKHAIERLVIK